MTPSELKAAHLAADPDTRFWDRGTMRFFGDTMRNFGVRRVERFQLRTGETVPALELYRRRPVKHGLQRSFYFHADGSGLAHGEPTK